jgi:purine nucleosidase
MKLSSVPTAFLLLALASPAFCQDKRPILLDTDIGSDIDDAFALALAVNHPGLDLRGVTTCGSNAEDRAWMVCRFLSAIDKKNIPVAWGRGTQPERKIDWQIQYRRHPAVIFNRTSKPLKVDAVEFLYQQLKAEPGKLTIVTTGPLTNIANLLKKYPECKPWIKEIVISYCEPNSANLDFDVEATKTVHQSDVPFILSVTGYKNQALDEHQAAKLFQAGTAVTLQVQSLFQLWDGNRPAMADALAVAICTGEGPFELREHMISLSNNGEKRTGHFVVLPDVAKFQTWYVNHVSAGKSVVAEAKSVVSKLIPNDVMPNRVHAFEDFETDIEKRWWMSGKAETKIVPPGSTRSCRGVLTQDFDDRMGNTKTMYNAVVFNPVPGPPMGKQPRLKFRYWLKGTDTMRVQIYSLTNGYHRCLRLKGLPQEQWQWGTVDMTEVRKPDGSGGPLSENERIDDIQFYVDPRAEVIIDSMVLYDAPVAEEKRPFPGRILFTGIFDTGKQGKEWPGTFDIDKDGYFWKAAKSVSDSVKGQEKIAVDLRGPRPVGKETRLFFRYHLQGADKMEVRVVDAVGKKSFTVELKSLKKGQWAEIDVLIPGPQVGNFVRQVDMFVPKGAKLRVDDLLLYALESH